MAADQKVKGGTDPGTPPARKPRRARKVRVRYADEADKAVGQAMAARDPLPEGTRYVRKANEFGPCRQVVTQAPKARKEEADPTADLQGMELYVAARLKEAGRTLSLMPGLGTGYSEREFPLPDPETISRMDEVLQVWLPNWCLTLDQRWVLGCYISGLSWRKAAKKDVHRRTHEGVRKAFLQALTHLTQQVAARGGLPPKWLLTELTKRG